MYRFSHLSKISASQDARWIKFSSSTFFCCRFYSMPRSKLKRESLSDGPIQSGFTIRFLRTTARINSNGDCNVYDFAKRGSNIILMGSPGAGKTTVGQMVAKELGMQSLDVDNDYLENAWGMTVAQKLSDVGSDGFVEAEGQALLQLDCHNRTVSLSGSNPMHRQAMMHIQSLGIVLYLDVEDSDILERLERMKVDRIVGQNKGTSMKDILKFRKQFYEGSYDVRITCEKMESADSITKKVLQAIYSLKEPTGYVSTRQRSGTPHVGRDFLGVVLEGLASDGGLYVPGQRIPWMTQGQWERLIDCTYQERALRILEKWISPRDLHPAALHQMIQNAYSRNFQQEELAPVVQLNDHFYVSELFHGPTASFKDFALQLTPQFFSKAIAMASRNGELVTYLILVATSGDTGSAVLEGFGKFDNIKVCVLYPCDGISEIQKRQMVAAEGANVNVVGIQKDFDFCQTAIKDVFRDVRFGQELMDSYNVKLSAANSINWGRLLPQVVYHVSAYLDLVKKGVVSMGEKADVCIPTGNFGNILAAYYAKHMGIPYDNIICASNENNILTDFFCTGLYDMRTRALRSTVSPSIDILKSSNLERFLYHVTDGDGELVAKLFRSLDKEGSFQVPEELRRKLSSVIHADWTDEQRCLHAMKSVYNQTGYLFDPHTAVAKDVANRFVNFNKPMIITATAHHSKFAKDVLEGLGKSPLSNNPLKLFEDLRRLDARPPMHRYLEDVMHKPVVHKSVCEANKNAIREHIRAFLRH